MWGGEKWRKCWFGKGDNRVDKTTMFQRPDIEPYDCWVDICTLFPTSYFFNPPTRFLFAFKYVMVGNLANILVLIYLYLLRPDLFTVG